MVRYYSLPHLFHSVTVVVSILYSKEDEARKINGILFLTVVNKVNL